MGEGRLWEQAPRRKDRSSKTGQNGTRRSELGGDHAGVLLKSPLKRTCYKECSWQTAVSPSPSTQCRAPTATLSSGCFCLTTEHTLCPRGFSNRLSRTVLQSEALSTPSFFLPAFLLWTSAWHIVLKTFPLSLRSLVGIFPNKSLAHPVPLWCLFLGEPERTQESSVYR